jgi:hypothetical protein
MIARMKKKITDSIKKVQTIGETVKTLQNNESGKSYEYVSKFLELLIRSLPGIFYAVDDNFKLLIWNENAENIS